MKCEDCGFEDRIYGSEMDGVCNRCVAVRRKCNGVVDRCEKIVRRIIGPSLAKTPGFRVAEAADSIASLKKKVPPPRDKGGRGECDKPCCGGA